MSIGDFLFNGQAPPSTTTYGNTVQNVPTWLSDYTQGLISRANAVGSEPYQAYQGPRVAPISADTGHAYNMIHNNVGAYAPAIDNAISRTSEVPGAAQGWFDKANSGLQMAGGLTGAAVAPGQGGLSSAMPWAGAASGSFTGDTANQYMNPYIGGVIDRSAQLATRNFNEQFMPQLNSQFISAGQPGSGRHQELAMRGARDVTQNIQDTANSQLASAYQSGQGAYQSDAARYANLAGTMGGLGSAQQNAMLQAGQQLGQIGAQYGTTGNQLGQLGLDAARNQGALAQTGQQMGVTDAAQLNAIGQQQQDLTQRSLDTSYNDFQNEVNYPRGTLDWMSNIIRGLPSSQSTSTSSTGPANVYQPSGLSQLTSLATGLTGLQKLNQNATQSARGGFISRARGGLAHIPSAHMIAARARPQLRGL